MDPFGNFGWDFGFGFGWILIGITTILMILAVARLAGYGTKDDRSGQEDLTLLKKDICAGKISVEEFEEKIKDRA